MSDFTFKEAVFFLAFAVGVFIIPSFFASWALVEYLDRHSTTKQEKICSYPIGDCDTTTYGEPCENPYGGRK